MGFRKKKIVSSTLKSIPRSQVIRVSDLSNYCDYSNTDFLIFAAEQKIVLCLLDGQYENDVISNLPIAKKGEKTHRKIPSDWFHRARENLDSDPWSFENLEIGPPDSTINIYATDLLVAKEEFERFLKMDKKTPTKDIDGRGIRWDKQKASIVWALIEMLVEKNPSLKKDFSKRANGLPYNMKTIAERIMADKALVKKYQLFSDLNQEETNAPLTTEAAAENLRKIHQLATS